MEYHERHGNAALGSACPTLADAWVEFYEDKDFNKNSQGQSLAEIYRVSYATRNERDGMDFETNRFDDEAKSVRWCIPSGSSFRVYKHHWSGPSALLNGTGQVMQITNLDNCHYTYGDGAEPAGASIIGGSISSGDFQENVTDQRSICTNGISASVAL